MFYFILLNTQYNFKNNNTVIYVVLRNTIYTIGCLAGPYMFMLKRTINKIINIEVRCAHLTSILIILLIVLFSINMYGPARQPIVYIVLRNTTYITVLLFLKLY